MQRAKIEAYCELNDLHLVEIVEDAGISAKDIKGRPGFRRALDMVYAGNAEALVVWKLDRAFRSTQDALAVAEEFNRNGKGLHSITEKLDTTSAIGEFFFTLMASLAQMERKLIGERTSAALQRKKEKGERVGQIPFGFQLTDDGVQLEPDLDEQNVIEAIHSFKNEGMSHRAIARTLNQTGLRTKAGMSWTHVQVGRVVRQMKAAA